jgi:nicotinamidase-related amidase
MNIRHPEQNLRLALASALATDLEAVDDALAPDDGDTSPRRPREDECNVVLFGQFWPAALLGVSAQVRMVEADTVVVCGPAGDACVYAAGRLLYHVAHPNRRFFLDLSAQSMAQPAAQAAYDGRDSADLEAVDYELEGALARLCGAARHLESGEALSAARVLREYVQRFEALAAA